MANDPDAPVPFSLRRWSQRKLEATREAATTREAAVSVPNGPAAAAPAIAAADASASVPPVPTTPALAVEDQPLPPVDSLTIDSDFAPYLRPKVAEDVKRAALKKLFSDPQFNVMDGLDIYIGDYTQPDPMPDGMLEKLGKVYGMLAKPEPTKVTAAAPVEPPAGPAEDDVVAPASEAAPGADAGDRHADGVPPGESQSAERLTANVDRPGTNAPEKTLAPVDTTTARSGVAPTPKPG